MARFVLSLLFSLAVIGLAKCSYLFNHLQPDITILADGLRLSISGEYLLDFAVRKDVSNAKLIVVQDESFGCFSNTSANNNITLPSKDTYFVVMLPYLAAGSPCTDYHKAVTAKEVWGAFGVIFYYTQDYVLNSQGRRPDNALTITGISITKVVLSVDEATALLSAYSSGFKLSVSVKAHLQQFQTTQTFYFIIFAFCILMLLSCLWFVMSYVKRCHYSLKRRRRRVRNRNADCVENA